MAGLQFEIISQDIDVYELKICATSEHFAGAINAYVGIGQLAEAAVILEGFPLDSSDTRQLTFGEFGREFAGGAIEMRFSCRDAAGHAIVETKIEA